MTEQMPPSPPTSELLESGGPAGRTGLAVTSMVLGILGLVTGCVGVGFLVGVAGLIIGIVALMKINHEPRVYAGKGFAITGIVTGAASLLAVPLLLIAILLPSLGKARELANRSYCAANLRGIMQSMVVYSNENADSYPLVMPPTAIGGYNLAANGTGSNWGSGPYSTKAHALKAYYGTSAATQFDSGSIPANMWILVLNDQCSPKQFICKSDPVASNISQLQTPGAVTYYINFNGANPDFGYSYSAAYPWTKRVEDKTVEEGSSPMVAGAWWKNTSDSSLPIMSDMAPANGSGTSPVVSTPGSPGGGVPANGSKAWNSANHQRMGQEVAFADAHSEWCNRPDIGQSNDNIFTTWSGASEFNRGAGVSGSPISGLGVTGISGMTPTAAPFDIVMVPVADVGTGARR